MAQFYTAAELIAHAKALIDADRERMERRPARMPRAAWRQENPIDAGAPIKVLDLNFKTRPRRSFVFGISGTPYDLLVAGGTRFVARIDLRAPEADSFLTRFERIA